jgi:hypothetical protein
MHVSCVLRHSWRRSNPFFLFCGAMDCSHGDDWVKGSLVSLGHRRFLVVAIRGSSRFQRSGCLPDQTHIRSSREATAPQFRLRRAGSRGRGHSSLRLLKPCNPSVRPPGSTEADRASADWLWSFHCGRRRCVAPQAALFITAPSMTTPLVTYFHKATRSLRASATIALLRPRWA